MYTLLIVAIVGFLWKTLTAATFDGASFGTGFGALVASGAGLQWFANKEHKDETDLGLDTKRP